MARRLRHPGLPKHLNPLRWVASLLLVCMAAATACTARSSPATSPHPTESAGAGTQVPRTTVPGASGPEAATSAPARVIIAGDPAQRGAAMGRQFGPTLRVLHPLFLDLAVKQSGLTREAFDARVAAMASHLEPDDAAEIQAAAIAAGMAPKDLLFLNLFYSLTSPPAACRQVAVWGPQTVGGRLLHARNLDWPDYPGQPLQKTHVVLEVRPAHGQAYVSLTWPGLVGVLTGANHAGLSVAFNTLAPSPGPARLSEPTFFTLGRVLRSCTTIDEAADLIRAARPMDNGSILIASSKERRAVVVEIVGGQVGLRDSHEAMIGNANHATAECGLPDTGRTGPADAPTCNVTRDLFPPESTGPLDARKLTAVLADPRVLAPYNLLSVVLDVGGNRMLLAQGSAPAAKGRFEELPIFSEP